MFSVELAFNGNCWGKGEVWRKAPFNSTVCWGYVWFFFQNLKHMKNYTFPCDTSRSCRPGYMRSLYVPDLKTGLHLSLRVDSMALKCQRLRAGLEKPYNKKVKGRISLLCVFVLWEVIEKTDLYCSWRCGEQEAIRTSCKHGISWLDIGKEHFCFWSHLEREAATGRLWNLWPWNHTHLSWMRSWATFLLGPARDWVEASKFPSNLPDSMNRWGTQTYSDN